MAKKDKEKDPRESAILEDILNELAAVACKVGGDFGMTVEMGKPGSGTCFNCVRNAVIFDPLQLEESPEAAIFIAGHEGAHRAITRSPFQLFRKRSEAEKIYSRLGMHTLLNSTEDAAVNDWLAGRYPGIRERMRSVYDDFAAGEGKTAALPEIIGAMQLLGWVPRFASYCYQIIRRWHTGQAGLVLDPAVREALKRTSAWLDRCIAAIPDPQRDDEGEIRIKARERLDICLRRIWPEYRKLVEMDLRSQELIQLLRRILTERGGKVEAVPLEGLPPSHRRALEGALLELDDTGGGSGSGKKRKERLGAFPLSPEAEEVLEKILQGLGDRERQELRDEARRKMEDLEDLISESLQGKLNPENPPTHRELRRAREREEEARKREEESDRLVRELEQLRLASLSGYDRVYRGVTAEIEALYVELRRFLLPNRYPRWKGGYPHGLRINPMRAMQAEKDPRQLLRLWDRKTLPVKPDHRFALVVDLSESMRNDRTMMETFKGTVVLVEVLERLSLPCAVIGFSDKARVFKGFEDRLDCRMREALYSMLDWGGGGTDTTAATGLAETEMRNNPGRFNFMVTLTDGLPNNLLSLKEKLDELEEEGLIQAVGVGIGPGTDEVLKVYPRSLHLPALRPGRRARERERGAPSFSEAFAGLLREMVYRPESYLQDVSTR